MGHLSDPLAPALDRTRHWLTEVATRLDTDDIAFAYRILRTWLHTLRDQLPVPETAHLGVQLPELLRGLFYETWLPSTTPTNPDPDDFVHHFATVAGIDARRVPAVAGAVTAAFTALLAPGQLDHVLAALPADIAAVLRGRSPAEWSLPEGDEDYFLQVPALPARPGPGSDAAWPDSMTSLPGPGAESRPPDAIRRPHPALHHTAPRDSPASGASSPAATDDAQSRPTPA